MTHGTTPPALRMPALQKTIEVQSVYCGYTEEGKYRGQIFIIHNQETTTTFDQYNNRGQKTDLLSKTTQLSCDDAVGGTFIFDYTFANGLIETVTDNLNNVTRYEYEPIYGLMKKIMDANLKDTTFAYTYDADNKITKTEMRDPLLHLTTTNYNSYGMQTSITDPNNNTTRYGRDTRNAASIAMEIAQERD